jgi:DNA-binding response OmpR family regulator
MGESAVTHVTSFAAPIRQRVRRKEVVATSTEPCTLEARIDASAAASARILRALHGGCGTFVLSAVDGQMSARVQLTVVNTPAAETEYKLGSARVTVDWSRSTIASGARRVTLSRTELRLFAALVGGDGHALSRAELISRVWPDDALPDADRENALAVYMCSLRKRLTLVGAGDALQTVRGLGYRAVL